jgi:hypothetical protein
LGPPGDLLSLFSIRCDSQARIVLRASSSSILGSTNIGWLSGDWFDVVGNGYFEGNKGDRIFLSVQLIINTWAENGKVEVQVKDFWIPSNTGHDIVCIRD